jgi:hypothetical protein
MTPEEVEARFQRIEALLAETAASQARTEAIANSNARAILANTEASRATDAKLDRLADLVERYIIASQMRQDATDIRVAGLENRVSDLENQ